MRATADAAPYGRRLLQGCSLEFQARSNTERLPLDYRLATIQDVEGTSLYGVLNDGDTALLVDGWVSYSQIRDTPIQFTGSAPASTASPRASICINVYLKQTVLGSVPLHIQLESTFLAYVQYQRCTVCVNL